MASVLVCVVVLFTSTLVSATQVRWDRERSSDRKQELYIRPSGGGQTFYGLGAISGGGATTRLLVDYPEPQRSEILDYLFKPYFGASLQMLKVEIGGDSQSTDGTEPSHMHTEEDLNYERGYEWWLMKEAKKRNPEIKLYGLPWAYPGWVGGPEQSQSPFSHPNLTAKYLIKWLEGARNVHGVDIDYLGVWNERAWDESFAKTLRQKLDSSGFAKTTIVAKDGADDICIQMAKDPDYAKSIGVVGLHYPSDYRDRRFCHKLGVGREGGIPLWASEESSSYNDANGAACWARVVASHWVLQNMTSSMMWNLVGSYFHGTAWYASSLLTANEPWTGNYRSLHVLWATAHVTQFTKVGWKILNVGSGSGMLPGGGFYVTYVDPSLHDWTLTIVKIDEDHASCTRPQLPHFTVDAENATFRVAPELRRQRWLAVWHTNFQDFSSDGTITGHFTRLKDVWLGDDGTVTLEVRVGALYTISTILKGPTKGGHPSRAPKSDPFVPLPYHADFEDVPISQEGKWWTDQIGSFEVHRASTGINSSVMVQTVPQRPIGWSDHGSNGPVTVLGMREWQDIEVSADVHLPADAPAGSAVCVGARLNQMWSTGVVLCVSAQGNFTLSLGGPRLESIPSRRILQGAASRPLAPDSFSRLSLSTVRNQASGSLNGESLFEGTQIRDVDTGFAGLGASHWIGVEFDNVTITPVGDRWSQPTLPGCKPAQEGSLLRTQECVTNGLHANHQAFRLLADWGIIHIETGLCVATQGLTLGAGLVLKRCDPVDPRQQFRNHYPTVRNKLETFSVRTLSQDMVLVGNLNGNVSIGRVGGWNKWVYFPNSRQVRNQYTSDEKRGSPQCLSVCEPTVSSKK